MNRHTDLYFGHLEQLFLVVPTKGHSFVQCPKGSVCNEGCPFVMRMMDPFHPKFRYKGAKPFWLWTTGEWIFYTTLMVIGWVIIILNDL